jgi:hypothetical protein
MELRMRMDKAVTNLLDAKITGVFIAFLVQPMHIFDVQSCYQTL